MKKTPFEEEVLEYALGNRERFAELLGELLPAFTAWTWGRDGIYRKYFNEWQDKGFNLLPNHYYSPIPDVSALGPFYKNTSAMIGLDLKEDAQIDFLDNVCPNYKEEYIRFPNGPTGNKHEFHYNNGRFDRVDAEILHCMIRHRKPGRVIEIGSGYSSLITAAACEMNRLQDNVTSEFIAIEPYPDIFFEGKIPGLSALERKPLQDIDMGFFTDLDDGDVLFIDSSHILKIGSDVQREYLEILPRLRPGVIVHIHDIFLPAEYPADWIREEHIFWNEQYLLQAFLAFNGSFEVLWAGSFMHLRHPEKLMSVFPGYAPERSLPGSFWIRRTK